MAPGDRAAQRPLALGQVARAAGEEIEARASRRSRIASGPNIRIRAAASSMASGQALETIDDGADRGQVGVVAHRVRADEPRAVDEELDPAVGVERRDAVLVLAGDPQ